MAKIISTINLKGGVGKTQMTVALAEFLSKEHGKRVLLIDLYPQTNATVTLIDENLWLEKHKKGETLLQLFQDQLDKKSFLTSIKLLSRAFQMWVVEYRILIFYPQVLI